MTTTPVDDGSGSAAPDRDATAEVEADVDRDVEDEAVIAQVLAAVEIPDRIELELPEGARAVVVSDLHLPVAATPQSTSVADELARLLGEWKGPGAFIIAGDGFEMLAGPPEVDRILDAHPQFTEAVARFARRTRPRGGPVVGQPRRPAGLGRRLGRHPHHPPGGGEGGPGL